MPEINLPFSSIMTLFVTVDPIGLAPMFLAATLGMSKPQRLKVATRAAFIGFCILALFSIAGITILSTFGITLAAFRVSGGILLFAIAFEMIFEYRQKRHQNTTEKAISDETLYSVAVFPLAIPLISGPGSISAVILLASEMNTVGLHAILVAIIAAIMMITFVVFFIAEKVDKILGEIGRSILTKLLGIILAALSVQFVADGIKNLASSS